MIDGIQSQHVALYDQEPTVTACGGLLQSFAFDQRVSQADWPHVPVGNRCPGCDHKMHNPAYRKPA